MLNLIQKLTCILDVVHGLVGKKSFLKISIQYKLRCFDLLRWQIDVIASDKKPKTSQQNAAALTRNNMSNIQNVD